MKRETCDEAFPRRAFEPSKRSSRADLNPSFGANSFIFNSYLGPSPFTNSKPVKNYKQDQQQVFIMTFPLVFH